jgi:putative oxidoreductase
MALHGLNHWRGGGKIAGTAGWFESLGLRPGRVHAWTSVLTEIAAGAALALGLLTSLAAGAIIGVMLVAGVIEHRTNGFFVFRNGYEYVLLIAVVCAGLALSGPGEISIDDATGLPSPVGVAGLLIALLIGVGGAALLLGAAWRPGKADGPADADAPAEEPATTTEPGLL